MTTPEQDRYDVMNGGYVRFHYGVPAHRNSRIRFEWDGREGTITGFRGQYLLVLFDGETEPSTLHPTWRVEYLPAPTPEQVEAAEYSDAVKDAMRGGS